MKCVELFLMSFQDYEHRNKSMLSKTNVELHCLFIVL